MSAESRSSHGQCDLYGKLGDRAHHLWPLRFGGVSDLVETIDEIREGIGVCEWRLLRNGLDLRRRTVNARVEKTLDAVRAHVMEICIRSCEDINKAQMEGLPVETFNRRGNSAEDFRALTQEVLN
ncbi:MAG: hypothetical protein ETSY2_54290 [Candidatus Entotheonella gemina]|uniref:Uncharacterized protein n=1 Tax=Candidatus Entotheonella gemina TaxID=1429439 RepID=W4L2A3_9BACT|nr:MAG: hypothetical protein ETSY2_54290 [Candidatus Entotheonella gemina]